MLQQDLIVHFIIFHRSPFLRAKVERWSDEKREIVIEDCDPEILAVVVDFMYGIDLPRLVVSFSLTLMCFKFNTSLYWNEEVVVI